MCIRDRLHAVHERCERLGVIRMPARQRRAVLDDIAGRPLHTLLVERARHVVVRAQDVEVAGVQPLDHEIDGLLRGPGGSRFFGAALRGQSREDKTRDQQMRAQLATRRIA